MAEPEPLLRGDSGSWLALAGEILRIAWPISLSWLTNTLGGIIVLILLRRDEVGMAAIGLANVLCNITGRTLLWGLGAAFDTYASQAWGANEPRLVGLYAQRVLLLLTVVVNLPMAALWLNADPLLRALGQADDVSAKVGAFARIRLPGQFAAAIVCVLMKVLISIGETRPLVIANTLCAVVSLALMLGLIWGMGLGVIGAAIALTANDLLMAATLLIAAVCNANCRKCWGGWSGECCRGWPEYLRLAFPSLLMVVCEEWSWDVVTFLAGLCTSADGGVHVPKRRLLAAQGWLASILNMSYSLSGPIGRGTGTLIGNALGGGQPARAQRAASVGVGLTALIMFGVAGGLLASRGWWSFVIPDDGEGAAAESGSGSAAGTPTIAGIMGQLLPYNAVFVWADGLQMALTGAITGAGAQGATTPVLVISYWLLGLPLGCVWAFARPRLGLLGIWLGMLVAVYLHMGVYCFICFGGGCIPCAIRWEAAAQEAEERTARDAGASGGSASWEPTSPLVAAGCTNAEVSGPTAAPRPRVLLSDGT